MNSRAEAKKPYRLEKSQSQVRIRKARKRNRNAYFGVHEAFQGTGCSCGVHTYTGDLG